jgi:gamma-D-glutamyl-L-lysine dipeptidyl-peptidase
MRLCSAFFRIALLLAVVRIFTACTGKLGKAEQETASVYEKFVTDSRTEIFRVESFRKTRDTIVLKGETTLPEAKEALFKTLNNHGIKLIDSILILPDPAGQRYSGLTILSVINLRKETDHASELVSQAIMGTPVQILKSEGSWLLVRTPDRYISWTERSSVRPVSSDEMEEWKKAERMIFTGNSGWIYSTIAESGVVGDIVAGCIVVRTGEAGDHYRVMLPDGREGFAAKRYLAPFREFIMGETFTDGVLNRAASMMGIPYLWGGSSSKGVDCSGYVQNVFFMNGLVVPRDASQQALYGKPVNISENYESLRPGDLLFFGKPERISHVAIYSGGGEYFHSSGRVMVNSLDSTKANYSRYRRNSLVKAARYIGAEDAGVVKVSRHPWY